MPALIKTTRLFPVWMASKGNKYVVAQQQQHAIDSFIFHYGYAPDVVINGLFAEKPTDDKDNAGGGGVGKG